MRIYDRRKRLYCCWNLRRKRQHDSSVCLAPFYEVLSQKILYYWYYRGFRSWESKPGSRYTALRKIVVPYSIVSTDIGTVLFDVRQESNPCSLCAKMRKGALNTKAKELGCNKIAYAHHKDDVIETMMLSLLYEGRFPHIFP